MLSRVAYSLYWMSRYMERSDGILRLLHVNYAYSQDDFNQFSWKPVLSVFSAMKPAEKIRIQYQNRTVLKFMITDKENDNSVLNLICTARENARSVQDNVTKELWQCLNEYYHVIRKKLVAVSLEKDDPISVIDNLVTQGLQYYGTYEITMARSEGYYFMNIGKYIERAILSVDILDAKFSELEYSLDETTDPTYWKYFLLSISGYELFLKSYRSALDSKNVVHQIVWSDDFPRSVLYSVNRIQKSFETLKSDKTSESYKVLSFMIGQLESSIRYSDLKDLQQVGLKEYLQKIKNDLFAIADALNHYYFAFN